MSEKARKVRRMLWVALLTVAVAYAAIVVLVFLFQSRLVYFPTRELAARPTQPYEAVTFQASDGVKLAGWFIPTTQPGAVVLFCHGNAGNVSHRLDSLDIFHGLGLGVLLFDYRGYGQSEGQPSEEGTYLDAEAAWEHLVSERGVPPERIVVFGESLGGAVAAWLAKEHPPGALILQSSFTSLPDLGAGLYPFLPVRLLSRFRYATKNYLRGVKCPVLILHSPADEIVPFRHGRELLEAANEPKEFLEMVGTHNEGFLMTGARYSSGLGAFLSRWGLR